MNLAYLNITTILHLQNSCTTGWFSEQTIITRHITSVYRMNSFKKFPGGALTSRSYRGYILEEDLREG